MRPIDIALADLETVRSILREHAPGLEVRAFGSRVSFTARETSDLDLALLTEEPLSIARMTNLKASFTKSYLPFRVDIVDWASTSEKFRKVIEHEHVVVLGKEESPVIDGWCECPLGELTDNFDFIRVPVKKTDRRSGHYPYYGASGIVDYVDDYLFEGEYLLVAEDGENLRTRNTPIAFLADGKFWVNNHAHIVRGNQKANTRYLMYALSDLDISGYLTGSTMPKLTKGNLDRISLLTPPLPEQRTIAHVLGTLDNKIELNRRMNKTLEEMTQALFKSWFVNFAPVRAKMEGRDTGLPQHLADLFPDRLIDSEIGEIPEGWRIFRLEELADHHTKSITPSSCPELEFEHFSIPAYDSGQMPVIERGIAIKSNKTVVPIDAILLSKLNPEIPRIWLPDVSSVGLQICSTEFLAFTPRYPANRSLLFSLFINANFRQVLKSMVTGTSKSHQRVPPKALKQCRVLSGMFELFDRFGELTEPMLAHIVVKRTESHTLAALRDSLLPKLISGEIRLRNFEKTGKV